MINLSVVVVYNGQQNYEIMSGEFAENSNLTLETFWGYLIYDDISEK